MDLVDVLTIAGRVSSPAALREAPLLRRNGLLVLSAVDVVPAPKSYAQIGVHATAMLTQLQPDFCGAYMNFVDGEDARRRTPDGYSPEIFRCLQALH
jgi:hypothetical protein